MAKGKSVVIKDGVHLLGNRMRLTTKLTASYLINRRDPFKIPIICGLTNLEGYL
jgi:hypothetical protein